jgi:CheY-like chemotaxis protein
MIKPFPLFLVAEDDPEDQFLFQDAIDEECPPEVKVDFVWDGIELIDYLKSCAKSLSQEPKLVILDLNMPRKDGRAALQEIKADPRLAGIPVVVLTNSINPMDDRFCQEQGAAGFYHKPNTMNEFKEMVRCLCCDYTG